jgi:hypothetical protein
VQSDGFAGAVADGADKWERLAVVVQRLLLLAQIGVDSTDVVQSGGLAGAVADGAAYGER